MKRLILGTLVLLVCSATAGAATLTITQRWTTVRAQPYAHAAAVALAFGNDKLPVLRRVDGWIAVRLRNGRQGWVRAEHGRVPPESAGRKAVETQ